MSEVLAFIRQQTRINVMRKALERVEWVWKYQGLHIGPEDDYRLCCPACQQTKEQGHSTDCPVGRALVMR